MLYNRLEVYGRENVPKSGGFIIASNHASHLDPPLLAVASPRQMYFFAKEELFVAVLGKIISACNAFPAKLKSADIRAIRFSIACLKIGTGLLMFPEGARSWDGNFKKPMAGVGLIAIRANAPIIPVYIQGSNRAMARGTRSVRPNKIRVYIGKQMNIDSLTSQMKGVDLYQCISEMIMQEIKQLKKAAEPKK